MSLAPAPILHNGSLNTTFNASDFNNSSRLNSTNVTGPLTVSGLATFNSGTQVNGTENVTGAVVCNTSTVNANQTVGGTSTITGLTTCNGGLTLGTTTTLTLPSTQSITSTITLVDTSTTQSIGGAKSFTTSLKTPANTVINSSNDVVDTANAQTILGAKSFSNNITLTSTTAPTTTGTQLGSTVAGTINATTTYTTATNLTVGSVLLANAGTYAIYGQGGIQCTTAGTITLAGVSLNSGSAVINNTCLSQSSITAVVGYYPLQVSCVFTVSANTTIYMVSNITFATGAFSANQSYSALKAVRIA